MKSNEHVSSLGADSISTWKNYTHFREMGRNEGSEGPSIFECSSEFICFATGREGGHLTTSRVKSHRWDPYFFSLLLRPVFSTTSVPVCFHRLIVPDSWRLCVTEVARFSGEVCGEEQQRLHWKCSQVPLLKILHVLVSEGTGRLSDNNEQQQ